MNLVRTKQEYWFLTKFDFYLIVYYNLRTPSNVARVNRMYKPKVRKIKPIDSSESIGDTPEENRK